MLPLLLAAVLAADPVKPGEPVKPADPVKPAEKPAFGPAPRFSVARISGDEIVLKEAVMFPVAKTVEEEVIVDGKKEKRTRTVTEFAIRTIEFKHPLKDVKAFSGDGKKLETKALAERLKEDTAVVVSMSDEVDPIYRKALKDSATILVLPRPSIRPPPPPPPKDDIKKDRPVPLPEPIKP